MSKIKKCSKLSSLLLFSILSAQACYADGESASGVVDRFSKIHIQSVQLAKVDTISGLRVFDMGEGGKHYQVSFASKSICTLPILNFKAADNTDVAIDQTNNFKVNQVKKMNLWKLDSGSMTNSPVSYKVSGENCRTLEGTVPELKAELSSGVNEDGSRTLVLTNVSSEEVTITEMISGKDVDSNIMEVKFGNEKKISSKGGTHNITLIPKAGCPSSASGAKFTFGYIIGNEDEANAKKHNFEINVNFSCDWVCEQITKELQVCEEEMAGVIYSDGKLKDAEEKLKTLKDGKTATDAELKTAKANLVLEQEKLKTLEDGKTATDAELKTAKANLVLEQEKLKTLEDGKTATDTELKTVKADLVLEQKKVRELEDKLVLAKNLLDKNEQALVDGGDDAGNIKVNR
jgi:hypothetical protein